LEWTDARIAALNALGRQDEVQELRWKHFENALSIQHLRDYLKAFPDFEDVEAEERGLDYVRGFEDIHMALCFFFEWPDRRRAADLVLAEEGKWDGNRWYILPDIAQDLAGCCCGLLSSTRWAARNRNGTSTRPDICWNATASPIRSRISRVCPPIMNSKLCCETGIRAKRVSGLSCQKTVFDELVIRQREHTAICKIARLQDCKTARLQDCKEIKASDVRL